MSEKELTAVNETIRLLMVLVTREETLGRKGDMETADWIRKQTKQLMEISNEHQEALAEASGA